MWCCGTLHGKRVVMMQGLSLLHLLIYHTHTYAAYEITETETYTPTEKWRTRDEQYNLSLIHISSTEQLLNVQSLKQVF